MSKNQYGVSMRHDPRVHELISMVAAWYDYRLQKAFDVLIYDRAEALAERLQKDLKERKNTPADEVYRKPTFERVLKELFDIDVPPFLQEVDKEGGRKPGKFQQRRTRHHKKGETT